MSARESCKWCTRPIATDADYESIAEGEGRHLCWSEFGNDPDCEGVDGAEDIITDLRFQLAAVTAERDALLEEEQRYQVIIHTQGPEIEALREERDALRARVPRQCQWIHDGIDGVWDTACGAKHEFTCDGPRQNHHRFCPYCGGHLIEMATDEPKGTT